MKTGLRKTNFRAVWLKLRIGDKDVDSMVDTRASGHNVIPQAIAEELGLEPVLATQSPRLLTVKWRFQGN